jgi:transposase
MPGTETTDLELRDRISKVKEILVDHGFAMSAVPEIAKTYGVSLRTAYRYKAEAEKELHAERPRPRRNSTPTST